MIQINSTVKTTEKGYTIKVTISPVKRCGYCNLTDDEVNKLVKKRELGVQPKDLLGGGGTNERPTLECNSFLTVTILIKNRIHHN